MHAGNSGDRTALARPPARAGAVVLRVRGRVTSSSERDANPLASRFAHRAYCGHFCQVILPALALDLKYESIEIFAGFLGQHTESGLILR